LIPTGIVTPSELQTVINDSIIIIIIIVTQGIQSSLEALYFTSAGCKLFADQQKGADSVTGLTKYKREMHGRVGSPVEEDSNGWEMHDFRTMNQVRIR
jgi:hypothetical protein